MITSCFGRTPGDESLEEEKKDDEEEENKKKMKKKKKTTRLTIDLMPDKS